MLCRDCNTAKATKKYDLCAACYFRPEVHKKYRVAAAKEGTATLADNEYFRQRLFEPLVMPKSNSDGHPTAAECDQYQYGYGADVKQHTDNAAFIVAWSPAGQLNANGNIYTEGVTRQAYDVEPLIIDPALVAATPRKLKTTWVRDHFTASDRDTAVAEIVTQHEVGVDPGAVQGDHTVTQDIPCSEPAFITLKSNEWRQDRTNVLGATHLIDNLLQGDLTAMGGSEQDAQDSDVLTTIAHYASRQLGPIC